MSRAEPRQVARVRSDRRAHRGRRGATSAAVVSAVLLSSAAVTAAEPGERKLVAPLTIDDGLAASLGELRGDRVHMGVDYRTQQKTGLAVRAVDRGVVIRLKEQWRGYGLAVYVQHPGGLVSVYAHLDRVIAPLEARLRKARESRGSRWAGDVRISSPFPVERGQTIAWSGESGAGPPHLHFELRRGMTQSIDPFAAGLELPRDDTPPIARRLIITPVGLGSTVDGSRREAVVELSLKEGRYVAARRPRVTGAVDLALDAFDQVGANNHAGLSALRVAVDDEASYAVAFDSIEYARNSSAGAFLDLAHSGMGPTRYAYRLTGLAGATLPQLSGGRGPLRLAVGSHRVDVELFAATTASSPAATRASVRIELDVVAARPTRDDPPPTAHRGSVSALDVEVRGDGLYVFAEPVPVAGDMPPRIGARFGATDVALELVAGYEGELPVVDGDAVIVVGDEELAVTVATLREDRVGVLRHGRVQLRVPTGALYAPSTIVAREVATTVKEEGLVLKAPAVRLSPNGLPFESAVRVVFDAEVVGAKSAVYRHDPPSESWSCVDMGGNVEVRRLGTYALIDDLAAPRLEGIMPDPATTLKPGDIELAVTVTDVGTGIAEHGVTMTIDGVRLDELYDPDRDVARASWKATPGEHRLYVEVEDYVGNVTERTLTLRVAE